MARPNTGIGRRGNVRNAGSGASGYGPGAAASQLPTVAVYFSHTGVTLVSGAVDSWTRWGGGWAAGTLTAPAADNRPAYSATGGTGGRPLITSDGTDDALLLTTAATGADWTGWEMGMVGEIAADGANGDAMMAIHSATAGQRRQFEEIGTLMRIRCDNATPTLITSTSTSDYSVRAHRSADWTAGAVQNIRYNGTVEDNDANDRVSYTDAPPVALFNITALSTAGAWNCMAAYFSYRQLTAAERTYLRALLTFHTGVTA